MRFNCKYSETSLFLPDHTDWCSLIRNYACMLPFVLLYGKLDFFIKSKTGHLLKNTKHKKCTKHNAMVKVTTYIIQIKNI